MRSALLRPIARLAASGLLAARRRGALRIAAASALVVGALAAVAGCGEDRGRPIPTAAGQDIIARLDEVERRVDARACNDVREDSLPALKQLVADLPSRVDDNIRTTLEDGLDRLSELVVTQCRRAPQPEPERTPIPLPQVPSTPEPQREGPTNQPDTPPTPDGGGDGGGSDGSDGGGSTGGGGSTDGGSTGDGGSDGGSGSLPPGGGTPGGGGGGPGGGVVSPPAMGAGQT